MEASLVLRDCRLVGAAGESAQLVDVAIADKQIVAIGPNLPIAGREELAIEGRLVSATRVGPCLRGLIFGAIARPA